MATFEITRFKPAALHTLTVTNEKEGDQFIGSGRTDSTEFKRLGIENPNDIIKALDPTSVLVFRFDTGETYFVAPYYVGDHEGWRVECRGRFGNVFRASEMDSRADAIRSAYEAFRTNA